jgi:hypothetical protein
MADDGDGSSEYDEQVLHSALRARVPIRLMLDVFLPAIAKLL